MNASDWTLFMAPGAQLSDLYDAAPALSSCDLFYVHIDEREDSVTLGFSTRQLPSNPPPEWQERDYNTVEFYLVFASVEGLLVKGWGPPPRKEVKISSQEEGRIAVSIGPDGSRMEFRASSMTLAHTRRYLAAHD
ncbi:Imm50 family immunity protein [Streptomyces mirabilis]|uniref:Imm50 family immunity protein n=1 Tax=Streptomyces mirabilis TaxID=68239 RepID=UPI003626842E